MSNKWGAREFKLKRRYLITAIVILLFVFIIEVSLSVEVKNFVRVTDDKVFLSDCLKGLSFSEREKAKDILVTYITNLGEEKAIKQSYIKTKLRQLKVDNLDNIIIPREVIIFREYQNFNTDNIYYDAINKLDKLLNKTDYEYTIDYNSEIIKVPIGSVSFEGDYKQLHNIERGKYRINYTINIDSSRYRNITIYISIGKKIYEYRLANDVFKGDSFSDNLLIKEAKIVYRENYRETELDLDDLQKKVFTRNIKSGTIITSRDLEKRILVRRNDNVKVYMELSGVTISFMGKALEHGYENEIIKIVNLSTNKIVTGLVLSDGRVKISTYD